MGCSAKMAGSGGDRCHDAGCRSRWPAGNRLSEFGQRGLLLRPNAKQYQHQKRFSFRPTRDSKLVYRRTTCSNCKNCVGSICSEQGVIVCRMSLLLQFNNRRCHCLYIRPKATSRSILQVFTWQYVLVHVFTQTLQLLVRNTSVNQFVSRVLSVPFPDNIVSGACRDFVKHCIISI